MTDKEWVEISVEFVRETELAILVNDGDAAIWIPKSQIRDEDGDYKHGRTIEIEIPEWLAIDKGMV